MSELELVVVPDDDMQPWSLSPTELAESLMADERLPWHGAPMRIAGFFFALGLAACAEKAPDAPAGDASVSETRDEGPIPPAPMEPGCAMSIDGEPLPPSTGYAELGHQSGQPTLTLACSGVEIEIRRPGRPGEYEAFASYGRVPRPEYRGACTTRLDRLAIKERGGLAARVRCDVPLMRDLNGTAPKRPIRIEGYVVLPPAGPLASAGREPTGRGQCTFSVTGEYTLTGRGDATSNTCGDARFSLLVDLPAAAIAGTFCPTCATVFEGRCSRTNIVERDDWVASDVDCELQHELSGEVRVKAHIDGPIVLTP